MSTADPSRYSEDPRVQPELTRLQPPGGNRAGSWRLAAAVIAVFLGGVIVAGRLGMDQLPGAQPSPSASPVAAASPAASPLASASAPPGSAPPASAPPALPPTFDPPPDVARYLDGLPTSIGGEKVYRLDSALARAGDRAVLVGGWYIGPECLWPGRCVRRLADSPATLAFGGHSVALAGLAEGQRGPYVLRVTRNDDCSEESDSSACYPVFKVHEVAWNGDLFTRAGPVEPGPLLGALKFAFPELRAEPFRDLARCPVEWPPQTYRSITGGPRMTVIFPTVEDREALETAIRTNWPQPASYPGAQCLDQFMDQGEPAGWIAEENVMLWVSQDPGFVALARAAILDARSQSRADAVPEQRPVTSWAALQTLRAWEADLDVLPPHNVMVWGPGLGPEGEQRLGDAYALNDPLIKLLVVFPDPSQRRVYERDVDAGDVVILDGFPPSQEALAAALVEAREVGVRWVGYRNVLLQVSGPSDFDRDLRRFLRRELR